MSAKLFNYCLRRTLILIWIEMEIIAYELEQCTQCMQCGCYLYMQLWNCGKNTIYMIEKVFNHALLVLVAIN